MTQRGEHRRGWGAWVLEWGLGLAIVAVILIWGDLGDLGRLAEADPRYLLMALASTILLATASCTKWRSVVAGVAREATPPWRQLYYYFFLARLTGLVAPMVVSDAGVRVASLRWGHRISLTHAGYSVYLERSFDLMAVLVSVLPSALFLAGVLGQAPALILLGAMLLIAAVILRQWPLFALRGLNALFLLARRSVGRLPLLSRKLGEGGNRQGLGDLPLRRGQAIFLFLLSLTVLVAMTLRFYFILQAVRVEVGFVPLLLCVPVAQLAMLAAVTPGGFGILEAGWYGIFALLHVPGPQIVLALVGARAFVVLFILILYALSWVWVHVGPGKRERMVGPRGRIDGTQP